MLSLDSKISNLEIIRHFKNIVKKFPQSVAVKDSSGFYTYKMLDKISDNMAINIIKHFNGEGGKKIVLFHEANNELIIAILAILKSGNTYIPVEKSTPIERIKYILNSSQAHLCLCDTAEILIENNISQSCEVKPLGKFRTKDIYNKISYPSINTGIAYIIYTSGTTGVPKGVEVTHKNVVSLVNNTKDIFKFSSKDNWLLFHSYSFDFSVWEIFGSLLTGGMLYIPQRWMVKNLELISSIISKENITILNQTPSSFYVLQEFLDKINSRLSIRTIIFGGEKLNFSKLRFWNEKDPLCMFVNMYGITEATVHTTYYCLNSTDFSKNDSIIGVPIPGWKVSLRNINGEEVTRGETGEIWIGGDGVTNGYVNNSELTGQRYVICEDVRWYKTGDLAYENEYGDLCYIGRIDNQVKIRGHRIELSEIDVILYNSIGIRSYTTVIEENDEQKLITFIQSETLDENYLRKIVKKYLPKYMMPTYFFFISEFPINMNGKIDQKQLLTKFINYSKNINALNNDEYNTNNSKYIQKIFRRHLKKNVEINENFFEVGGDSLMAMKITKEINEYFSNLNLSIVEFYQNSTIKKLEKIIGEKNVV